MLDRVPTENICSVAASAEQLALRDAVHACAERTTPIAAVRAADPAALRACWAALAEVGVFGVALPAELGGAGGTVPDAAAALEQAAAELLPGPVLPTVLAGLLLARHPDAAVAKELLSAWTRARCAPRVTPTVRRCPARWGPYSARDRRPPRCYSARSTRTAVRSGS